MKNAVIFLGILVLWAIWLTWPYWVLSAIPEKWFNQPPTNRSVAQIVGCATSAILLYMCIPSNRKK